VLVDGGGVVSALVASWISAYASTAIAGAVAKTHK
jgi:hypothetical protein